MKNVFTLLIVTIITLPSVSQISPTDLVVCYQFDDTTDSFNSYDGTLAGNATTNGKLNIGLNNNDAFFVPGHVLNLGEFTVAFEVEFTGFNTNHQSAANTFFSGASAANDNLLNFVYVKDQLTGGSATLSNTVYYLQDNQRFEFNNVDLVTDSLYHITLVRSQTNLKLYINGAQMAPLNGITISPITSVLESNGLVVGQDQDVLAGGFVTYQSLNGKVDNFHVYDRPLNSYEVLQNFKGKTCERFYQYKTSEFSEENNTNVSSLQDNLASQFEIFPNPAAEFINVQTENTINFDINIYGLDGKLMFQKSNMKQVFQRIDISDLAVGTYIIELKDSKTGQSTQKKFIKL